MDEGKIVLIGNESDVLHCGYSHAISDSGKRYPSAVHYTHSMILTQLGVSETAILELLCTSSAEVPNVARQLLLQNMPNGHDMNTLSSYLSTSKQSYTMQGLRLRVDQDQVFGTALMNTRDALLIVCDKKDSELGIGMDEAGFMEWMQREKADGATVEYWMRNEKSRPPILGANHLGFFLMWLRYEVKEKRRTAMLTKDPIEVDGLSTGDDDKPVKIKVNEQVIALQGIFRPLSNYYPARFTVKGESYRSVEHYAYEKLFNNMKLDEKLLEKIQTTVLPQDVHKVAYRVFQKLGTESDNLESKLQKLDRWRQSAMKHKVQQSDYLQKLLLSTGDALLIDVALGEELWTCAGSEFELQHLLTKSYVDPSVIIKWMRDKETLRAGSVEHLRGNKAGLLLMELRTKMASQTDSRIPLVMNMSMNLASMVSQHVICFTAESVFHPLYPAEIRSSPDTPSFTSPAHYIASQAVKFLGYNKEDSEYVMEPTSSLECWERLHETLDEKSRGVDREQTWWMEKRLKLIKEAIKLLLEQHPPILRALLDTGDAMLVFCSRFCSMDSELSIGMREHDLRVWLATVDLSTTQLIELCTRPLAFRPPYLGGNRIGFILMELRREFVLRGVFPHTLPELPLTPDVILGTDSPTESMVVTEHFDCLDRDNYTSLWINPFMSLAKSREDAEFLAAANYVKQPPRLLTVDEAKVDGLMAVMETITTDLEMERGFVSTLPPEDMRAILIRIRNRLASGCSDIERQMSQMSIVTSEVNRLQTIRRSLEDSKQVANGMDTNIKDRFDDEMCYLKDSPRMARDRVTERNRIPSLLGSLGSQSHLREVDEPLPPPRLPQKRKEEGFKISNNFSRIKKARITPEPHTNRSEKEDGKRTSTRRERPPLVDKTKTVEKLKPVIPKVAPKPVTPIKHAPKPKPKPEELSDGEILSSDED